ncbi:MAG: putative transport system permease protein [Thermoanaerobaculia bacterium]|jgi:putative ABC transport system permease protein|nr:putative transport system permease protein [Thermoanaerobaculia bacterium]
MLLYNVRIAIKSLRRNPVLTAVIIGGIALGICASTTFTTVRHMFARDPLPGKSDRLFYVRMDNWDPHTPYPSGQNSTGPTMPPQVSYRDAMALMRSNIPLRQTAAFRAMLTIYPDPRVARPSSEDVRLCFSDFFTMFDVPFAYGGPWDRRADAKAEQVVVIDDAMNQKLFKGVNSVGKRVRIDDREFTVVGVLKPWRPFIKMYDLNGNFIAQPEPIYLPFSLTPGMQIRSNGNSDGWKSAGTTFEDFLNSDTDWVQLWVELRSPADAEQYHRFVDGYVLEEKKHGRFERPLMNRVTALRELMGEFGVITPQINAMAAISILFLAICALNLTGLLLGKFLARSPEVSVRRALGATRIDVFLQHITECELVGLAGGALGMLLSIGAMKLIGKFISATSVIALDSEMILAALFLSLGAGLLAGLYPAWRICSVQPAVQLKI